MHLISDKEHERTAIGVVAARVIAQIDEQVGAEQPKVDG
jgi:hypothetical protein